MTKDYDPPAPLARRQSATAEDLAARRTEDYPPASRHRVGHTPGLHGEDAPYESQEIIRPGLRTIRGNGGYSKSIPPTRTIPQAEDEEQDYPEPRRRAKTSSIYRETAPTRRLKRTRFHWLVFVGIGLFIMIAGWLSFSALSSWYNTWQDDMHYGRPRTFQTDAVVGHNDSASHPSHFIAINLNGKIEVIEIPGGDPSKSQIYIGPTLFGSGQDLVPVTLSFDDCDGNGDPDLIIHIQGSDKLICFPNNGKTFVTQQQH